MEHIFSNAVRNLVKTFKVAFDGFSQNFLAEPRLAANSQRAHYDLLGLGNLTGVRILNPEP